MSNKKKGGSRGNGRDSAENRNSSGRGNTNGRNNAKGRKNNKIVAVLSVVAIVIAVIIAVLIWQMTTSSGDSTQDAQTEDMSSGSDTSLASSESSSEEKVSDESSSQSVSDESAENTDGVLEDTEASDENGSSGGSSGAIVIGPTSSGVSGGVSEPWNVDDSASGSSSLVTFPYEIPGTSLIIQSVQSYEGIFLEDGSDTDAAGISAIILQNAGGSDIEFARIEIECDGTQLSFDISGLVSGGTVVAQEMNRTPYAGGTYMNCTADVAEKSGGLEQSADQVRVEENENGSLVVTNLTDSEIPCVRVFYKFYMNDENVYVGGITYTAKITNLTAGESRSVTPSHYSKGYSRVVMVRTYDTTE